MIKYIKSNVTLKEVRDVCKKAYIDDYIMSLPEGTHKELLKTSEVYNKLYTTESSNSQEEV